MFNFKYEDDFKIKNKYFAAISSVFYLPKKTIGRPPQSRETIPLNMKIIPLILSQILKTTMPL
jgi:hypothetical protein